MDSFPNGARIAFIGDSMTAANQTLARIIDHYQKHFPERDLRFFNCGISGGTAASAIRFYDTDILPHHPTHAVVSFGINDSLRDHLKYPRSNQRMEALQTAFKNYKHNLRGLVQRLLSDGIAVTLCTPAPYDEYSAHNSEPLRGGYALMQGYADFVRNLAQSLGLPLCDHHQYLTSALQSESFFAEDRIHPNDHGYYRMAESFLEFQGLQIDAEAPIPEYLSRWSDRVKRLRRLFGAEHMLLKDPTMTEEEKLAYIRRRVADGDFGKPVFEQFYRAYAVDKPKEALLCQEICEIYKTDILGHYVAVK